MTVTPGQFQNLCHVMSEILLDKRRGANQAGDRRGFQWVWAVLSAFDKSHSLSEILSYPLPNAQDYNGFWDLPLAIQHPLAEIEIVPWDSSMTMIFSKRKDVVDSFRCHYPCSEDMEDYIRKLQAL